MNSMVRSYKRRKGRSTAYFFLSISFLVLLGCEKPREFPTFFDIPDSLFLSKFQRESGEWAGTLKAPTIVYGFHCKGGIRGEYNITVLEDSSLFAIEIVQPVEYQGIPCSDAIGFFPNGNIRGTKLSKDLKLENGVWAEEHHLGFFENGKIKDGTLADNLEIGDFMLYPGNEIEFWPNGNLRHIDVGNEFIQYKGKELELYDFYFCEDGTLDWYEKKVMSNPGEIYW